MKKLTLLVTLTVALITLSGCYKSTTNGGDNSLTQYVNTQDYKLSDKIKLDIKNGKEKIIITETLNNSMLSYNSAAQSTTNFIHSVNNVMEDNGYTILSTDTNGMGEHGTFIFVTLVFAKKDKDF